MDKQLRMILQKLVPTRVSWQENRVGSVVGLDHAYVLFYFFVLDKSHLFTKISSRTLNEGVNNPNALPSVNSQKSEELHPSGTNAYIQAGRGRAESLKYGNIRTS